MVNRSAVAGSAQVVQLFWWWCLELCHCWGVQCVHGTLELTHYRPQNIIYLLCVWVFFGGGVGGGKSGDHLSGQSGNVCVLLSDCWLLMTCFVSAPFPPGGPPPTQPIPPPGVRPPAPGVRPFIPPGERFRKLNLCCLAPYVCPFDDYTVVINTLSCAWVKAVPLSVKLMNVAFHFQRV